MKSKRGSKIYNFIYNGNKNEIKLSQENENSLNVLINILNYEICRGKLLYFLKKNTWNFIFIFVYLLESLKFKMCNLIEAKTPTKNANVYYFLQWRNLKPMRKHKLCGEPAKNGSSNSESEIKLKKQQQ